MAKLPQHALSFICFAALLGSVIFFVNRRLPDSEEDAVTTSATSTSAAPASDFAFDENSSFADLLQDGTLSSLADPSFEMRENVDFLLTPALLIQEAISDDMIITYPEE